MVDWCNDTSYFIEVLLTFEPPCMSKWMIQAFLSGFSGGALAALFWFVEVSQAWYVDTASHVVIHVPWDQKPTIEVVILKLRSTPPQNTMFNSTYVFAFGCFKVMSSYMLDSNKIVHSTCCPSGKMQQSEKETEESLAQLKHSKSWRVCFCDSHRGTFRLIIFGCSVVAWSFKSVFCCSNCSGTWKR